MSASAQRRAYGIRNSLTRTTLSMSGALCTPTDADLPAFVFAEPEVGDDDVLMARIGEWIAHRGPTSGQTNGNDEAVNRIWELARDSEITRSSVQKQKEGYDRECVKIEKVKVIQVAKWGALDDQLRESEFKELNEWCDNKKALAYKPVAKKESDLSELLVQYNAMVKALLKTLKGTVDQPEDDPECFDLMLELETKFGEMTVQDEEPEMTAPVLTAPALALEHVRSLPDGPQKSALFAVLQAATPSEAYGGT